MRRVFMLVVCATLLPAAVHAQDDESHWGVAVSIRPNWEATDTFKVLWDAETAVDIKSTDFAIGIARGRTRGGDWNVNYIRKTFKDGSTVDSTELRCDDFAGGCFTDGKFKTLRNVTVSGIEGVKFIKFANIKDRVQIGMNVGGGVGSLKGQVDVVEYNVDFSCNNFGQCGGIQRQRSLTVDAGGEICDENGDCDKALFALDRYVMGKVEAAVGVIIAPGLKIRFAGGLDFPGSSGFNVTGVYLIGAR